MFKTLLPGIALLAVALLAILFGPLSASDNANAALGSWALPPGLM